MTRLGRVPFTAPSDGAISTLDDPIAQAFWRARATASPLQSADAPITSLDHAQAIADELYKGLELAGAHRIGWKVGATDRNTQVNLGAEGPFSAPIFSSTIIGSGAVLSLQQLIAPRIELEIGFRAGGGALKVVPCIEIVDCRTSEWQVSIRSAIADFGLQALMIFGAAGSVDVEEVSVRLLRDGELVSEGSRDRIAAEESFAALPGGADELRESEVTVASGTIIDPVSLSPGRWTADFGALGELVLHVVS